MKHLLITTLSLLLLTGTALAAQLDVGDGMIMEITPADGWTLSREAPDALIDEIAEHLGHEAEERGATPTQEQLRQAARQRLAANEAILFHPSANAHLDIDFSPLDPGQKPPNRKTLKKSAQYAAQSLAGEEGVTDVDWEVSPMKISGARDAYVLTADYRQHDEPVRFLGVIGFAGDQWFFLYYTDRSQQPELYRQMQAILDSVLIRTAAN